MAAENPSLYRAIHHMRHGGLHSALHVAPDAEIPEDKIAAAEKSSNKHVAAMAGFAKRKK